MGRLRVLLPLAALLALALPAGAEASRFRVSTESTASPPSLAGQDVVYLHYGGSGQQVRAAGVSAPPRTLRTFPLGGSDDDCCATFIGVGIDTSPTRLATAFHRTDSAKGVVVGTQTRLETGPLAGPPAELFSCARGDDFIAGGYDLDGDRIAFVSGGCGNDTGRSVVVRDLATGSEVASFPAPAGRALWDVRVAGNHVAYSHGANAFRPDDPRQVTVRDLTSGTDLFTVDALTGFDVQADGKLVVNTRAEMAAGCPATVDWYSPAEPTRHATGICATSQPVVHGDRIAVLRKPAGTLATDVVVSDLAGNALSRVQADSSSALGGVDFDGTNAAYTVETCRGSGSEVYLDDLEPADAPIKVPGACPLAVRGASLRAGRSGRVRLSFECPRGCSGFAHIYARRRDDPLTRQGTFDTGPGRTSVTVKLDRRTRLALARRGRLNARVVGESRVLDGRGSRTFRRKVTLLAPRRSR